MIKSHLQLLCWFFLLQVNCQDLLKNPSESYKNQENTSSKFKNSLLTSEFLSNSPSQPRSLLTCYSGCSDCTDIYFNSCTSCSTNYILWEGMCLFSCPTGFLPSSGTCLLDHAQIFYFTFNKIQGYFDFPHDSLSLICGNSAINFYPDYDNNDPFPSKTRGYYFDPEKSYMQLPPNNWSKDDFILSYKNTIALWIWRRDVSFTVDYLLYKESRINGDPLFYVSISPSTLVYNFTINSNDTGTYTDSSIALSFTISDPRTKWTAYAISSDYSLDGTYTVTLYENNSPSSKSSNKPGWSFSWYPESQFLVGFVNDAKTGLDGWLSEFGIYSITFSASDIGDLYVACATCSLCPASTSFCFSACDLPNFFDGDFCSPCESSCKSPCVSSTTCNLCDSSCGGSSAYCTGFSSSDCFTPVCNKCLTCSGNDFYDCFTCDDDSYLYKGICIAVCPGRQKEQPMSGGSECKTINGYDFELTSITGDDFYDIKNDYLMSPSDYYKIDQVYDPIPSYKRGFYFNGISSYLSTKDPLRFDIDQTHSWWLKTYYDLTQTLLYKQDSDESTINLQIQLVLLQLKIHIRLSTQDSDTIYEATMTSITVTEYEWGLYYVIIRFIRGYTYWKVCASNYCTDFSQIGPGYYFDTLTSPIYGVNNAGDYFIGFLWEIMYDPSIWDFNKISLHYSQGTACEGGWDLCLYNNQSLVDCDWNFYYDENTNYCFHCLDRCAYGCMNNQDCSFCGVYSCEKCDNFTSTTCNQCYAGTTWNSTWLLCECPEGTFWDPQTNACYSRCYSTCSQCTINDEMDKCTACYSGYTFYNDFCVKNCPIGYSVVQKSCSVSQQSLVVNFEFKNIENTQYDSVSNYSIYMGTTDEYYPNYDINDPWVLPYRGLYFQMESIAKLNVPSGSIATEVSLGLNHTIDIWTMVDDSTSNGLIFGIYTSTTNLINIIAQQYDSSHFYYKATYSLKKLDGSASSSLLVESSNYAYSTWQRVTVAYSFANGGSNLKIFINAQADGSSASANYCFNDNYAYTVSLGSTGSNFKGYVYALKLYNYAETSVNSWISSCGYPYCTENNDKLIICKALEYYDDTAKACKTCSSSCNYGCKNGKDCNLCAVTACELCETLFSTTCDKCYDGTTINSAKTSCDCPSDKIWNYTSNACVDNPCYSACSACTTFGIIDQCTACKSGYLFYNNFCVKNCPIGYSISQNYCVANNQGSLIINFEYTKTTNTQYDSVSNYSIYMGTTDDYYPNYDSNDPWVLPYRGLYFKSVSVALLHVPSGSQVTQIIFGLNHTISIWTMVDAGASNGLIFGLYNANGNIMTVTAEQYNSTHFSYKVAYWMTSLDVKTTAFLSVQSSYYAYSTWQQVVVTYSYANQESILKIFVNTKLDGSISSLDYVYYDYDDYTISLGSTTSDFVGYVYSLKLYNYVMQSISTWTSSCGYPYCTENNDKLIICKANEYYDESSKTCKTCGESCTVGCIRKGNICNLNQDPLCSTYTDLKPSGCTQCKADSKSGPPCACNNWYMYDSTTETCICVTGYQYINGKCVPCYRYIQQSEISGYFTSTFVRVIVDLVISVNTTDLICEKVFTSDTISKFGSGYVCYFDSIAKEIIIDLGDGFTLTNELIKIIGEALFGLKLECGYSPNSLRTNLTYSSSLPYPTAKIDAPSTVLYNCQNLTISGKKSTGSIKSSLYYKWSIISEPSLSLSKYNTDFQQTISEFTILNSELSTATITVTLTVKNKFNNENTASFTINSIPDGFAINFDNTIDYQSAAPDRNTYGIGSISSCNTYNNLSLKWKLANVNGNYSAVNEDAIWGNQTKVSTLNIPSRVLWPYTNATFSLEAADSTLNIEGSGSFEVSIIPNPPIIEFSRTNGSADISSSLFINANSSYDPNVDKSLSYEWTCTQASLSCSSFISNTKAENLTISQNTLQSGKRYQFALKAVADFSSRRQLRDDRFLADKSSQAKQVITINTVNYAIPTVNIINPLSQSQPTIIAANTMIVFQATIDGGSESQYTYQWSVNNTATIKFSTPLNQLFLAIVEGTLEIRHSYTLTLTVSDNSKYSYFTYQFYINSPPYSGNLAVTPSSGVELETVFKMEALGWVDDENNLPLSYSFGYWRGNGENYLNFKNQSLTYFSTFPYIGDTLTLFVDVYDNLGAYSTKNASITISINKNLDQKELYSNYKNYINSIASNPQSYPGLISTLCDSVLNRDYWLNGQFNVPSLDLAFYKEIIESALGWVEDIIQTSQIDSQSISTFSALLSRIILNPYLNSSSTEKRVCDMIVSIFNSIPIDQMLEKEQPYKYFIVVNEAFLYNSSSIVTEKEELENAIEALSSIEKLMLSQMVLNEVRNITANNFGITTVVMPLSAVDGYKFISSNGKASITFPNYFSSEISSITDEKVVNLALSVLDCPNNPNNLSSSIVDFTMYGHSSNQKISVNLADSNILVQIPVWNVKYSNYTPECVFLDTKTMNWSTEGCTNYKINSYDIVCSCNHFTTFTAINAASSTLVDSNIGDTVNAEAWSKINSSNAIGLYFCIVTLIVYGIFGFLAYKKDRKEEREEDKRRKKLLGDPKKLEKITTMLKNVDNADKPIEHGKRKKKCWPCKNKDKKVDNSDPDNSFNAPEVVFVYSFTSQQNSENATEEDNKYIEIKKWAQFTVEKHELLNIMFIREPERPSFSRITLFFLALLGQMFFIGMFYQNANSSNDEIVTNNSTNTSNSSSNSTNSTDSSSSNSLVSYSWFDFWIMIWSSLIMILITVILNKFLREKLLDDKMTEVQFRKIRKQNKIKRWIGIILAWGIMFYFCWSIVLFAIQFKQSISKTWVLNTGISYLVNIFVTSVIKTAAVAFITIKVMDWYERYKLRKYRENNELDSDDDTE